MNKIISALAISTIFAGSIFSQDLATTTKVNARKSTNIEKSNTKLQSEPLYARTTRSSYDNGAVVNMDVSLDALLGQSSVPTSTKVYFSLDSKFDFEDEMLDTFEFEASQRQENISFSLPSGLNSGNYWLILVAQTEGGVLMSKMASSKIWVTGEE